MPKHQLFRRRHWIARACVLGPRPYFKPIEAPASVGSDTQRTPAGEIRKALLDSRRMETRTIAVLEGDETGQELLEEALRVLAPDVVGLELELPRFDLSLDSRRKTQNQVVHEAAAAIREAGLGLKAATVTPEGKDDVGSPNQILREEIGGHVIVRTGRRIPGVVPIGGVHQPISVVRMAVGDAYGAKEWREGDGEDEVAFRTMKIERRICRAVAEFSFRHAERTRAKVFGGRSTPSAPCTRACSRRRWTRPPSGIPTSSTSRSSSTRRSRSSSAPRARRSSSRR